MMLAPAPVRESDAGTVNLHHLPHVVITHFPA